MEVSTDTLYKLNLGDEISVSAHSVSGTIAIHNHQAFSIDMPVETASKLIVKLENAIKELKRKEVFSDA